MRYIFSLLLLVLTSMANTNFQSNQTCKACHPSIYNEFQTAQHAKSSIFDDEIHSAVWKQHPKNKKYQSYSCAKCHTPASKNLKELVTKHNGILPDKNDQTQRDGISCAYCHRIESIKHAKKMNKNIISKEQRAYYGTLQDHIKSPFHKIKTENEHFKNGNVCIGCHSHKQNKFGMNVCSTNIHNELDGANCVSCHMPKVDGSVSTMNKTKKHTFHGFAGTHSHQEMLTKYVDLEIKKGTKDFKLIIKNKASHALSLHPLRVMQVRVSLTRDGKTINFKPKSLARIIGANSRATPPWLSREVVKDDSIKANETRIIDYNYEIKTGDKIEVTLGYFLVNPKMLKKLNLQDSEVSKKFYKYKTQLFTF